jgi:hypothetical protein
MASLLSSCPSIMSLSICDLDSYYLSQEIRTTIQEKIQVLRVKMNPTNNEPTDLMRKDHPIGIIRSSILLKKIILDGSWWVMSRVDERGPRMNSMMEKLKPMCREKNIELSKENFRMTNGRVDCC